MKPDLKTAIFVDDQPEIHNLAKLAFKKTPSVTVTYFLNPREGLDYLKTHQVDLAIIDYQMPGLSGLDFLNELKTSVTNSKPKVVVLTGDTDPAVLSSLTAAGASKVLQKGDKFIQTLLSIPAVWQNL